jgi:hypothetical protein
MNLEVIKNTPTVVNNVHESVYKSSQVLTLVEAMLKRGDSMATILMVVNFLYDRQPLNGFD